MFRNFFLILTVACFEIGAFPFLPDDYRGENVRAVIILQPNNSAITSTRKNESVIEIIVEESKSGDEKGPMIYLRQDEGEGVELPAIFGGGGGAELFAQLGQLFNAIFAGGLRDAIRDSSIFKNGINFGSLFRGTTTTTTTTKAPPVQKVKNPVTRKPTVQTTAQPSVEEEYVNEILPVTTAKPQIKTTVRRRVIKTTLPPENINYEEY